MGACIALPALESLLPRKLMAAGEAVAEASVPLRTAFIYVPNGAQQLAWFPEGSGRNFKFNRTMEPLESLKGAVQVISGLDHVNAEAGPDGAGDHARANATFLTGVRARKTAGADIHLGESIDQLIARKIGDRTRFSSLELSCEPVRKSGQCDSGYSCAYQFNISWRSESTPMTSESNPRLVFERLFGAGDVNDPTTRELRRMEQRSILDFVLDDASALQKELGQQDRRKLDEYLTGVREIEQRIERAEQFPVPEPPPIDLPEGVPSDYGTHMDLMLEMLAIAFETDSTRVATLLLGHDGSNRPFPQIGIAEGHHSLTHEQREEEAREKVAKIDRYYMEYFARFLKSLSERKDADGSSLLDNSMVVYGSGIADADRHTHSNLPVILAGGGRRALQPGQYLQSTSMPMSNLYLSLLDRLGIDGVESFGDSTGRLNGI
jgi:hypothetical protein